MATATILDIVFNGVVWGGIYALMSTGFSLQYGVARVLNLSHGEFIMLGSFLTFEVCTLLGITPLLSLPIVGLGLFIIGFLLYGTLFRKLRKSSPSVGAFEGSALLATFGLLYIIQYAAILEWGSLPYNIRYLTTPIRFWGVVIPTNRIVAFAFAIGISLALYFFLSRTRLGKAIRAAAQDPATAGLMGVNINMVLALCFGLGALLAGFAGVLHILCFPASTIMGLKYTLIAIIVVVLGGLGSIPGCFIGGLILGIVGYAIEHFEPLLSLPAFYVIFLVLLLVRPTGIFGKR
jgi:branched-chain amino acid transport system permease protein